MKGDLVLFWDWILFAGWVALVVAAWNVNVKPQGKTSRLVSGMIERVPVRHEKKRDKRGRN